MIINEKDQAIMIQNHSQGWIEVKKVACIERFPLNSNQGLIYQFFNEEEDKTNSNLSPKISEPKYIVKVYDPQQKSNSIQIFSYLSYSLQTVAQVN